MDWPSLRTELPDQDATEAWGKKLAVVLKPGLVMGLKGPLGAGKTTLVRALLRGLGVTGHIKSPTYALLEIYEVSRLYLYHFDFYRINSIYELEDAGFREYFNAQGLCFVEWPERALDWLPPVDIWLELEPDGVGRRLTVSAGTVEGVACLERLQKV